MAELRKDWLTGRSVLVAENRALRPNEFAGEPASAGGNETSTANPSSCPFCAGNESRTPPAVYEKFDQQGRWQVRVVPNMYPAVTPLAVAADVPSVVVTETEALALTAPAIGAHEVIIESANHLARMSELSKSELRCVLGSYAERLRHWRDDGRFRYGLVFKNQGPRAGASIAHLHSQLIALPFVPAAASAEIGRAHQFFNQQHGCAYCELVEREQSAGGRSGIARA